MPINTNQASNQTADKLLIVMEAFAMQPQPIKLSDLSKQLDMNISTLYRFTSSLQKCGYVNQLSDGRYEISLKICYLAEQVQKRQDLAASLHSFVQEACDLFSESAHIAVEENHMIVYINNVVNTSQSLTFQQHIGKTAPMYCTGIGKLFLSEWDEIDLDSYLGNSNLKVYTANTVTSKEAMQKEFEFFAENGFLYDNEECEIGVRCVAVPIRNYTGKIVAGLSISGPTTRLTLPVIAMHIEEFKKIALKASRSLGYMR